MTIHVCIYLCLGLKKFKKSVTRNKKVSGKKVPCSRRLSDLVDTCTTTKHSAEERERFRVQRRV